LNRTSQAGKGTSFVSNQCLNDFSTRSSTLQEIIRPLPLSLEDLYCGTTKSVGVLRKLLSGRTEEKAFQIQVVPGWKQGTKIRFPNAGDEIQSGVPGIAQEVVFEVEEKVHPKFKRVGHDLYVNLRIPLVDALTNPPCPTITDPSPLPQTIRTLDSRVISIPVPYGVIKPGQTTRIPDEGMPRRVNGARVGKGDLIIKWFVVYPAELGLEQRKELAKILRERK